MGNVEIFNRLPIHLTQHQLEMIRAIRNNKLRAAKRRARIVTRAKAAKGRRSHAP